MSDALMIPVGDHLVRVIDAREEVAMTGSTGISIGFEDNQKRRHWRHAWLTAGAFRKSLTHLRLLGFEGEPNAAGFTAFLKSPPIGKEMRIRVAYKKTRPGETEVVEVWGSSGVSPEDAAGSRLAYAVEQARLGRKSKAEPDAGWSDDETKEAPVSGAAPNLVADPLIDDLLKD